MTPVARLAERFGTHTPLGECFAADHCCFKPCILHVCAGKAVALGRQALLRQHVPELHTNQSLIGRLARY